MKRHRNVIFWLALLILLNAASAGLIYWQQSQKVEALYTCTLAESIDKYLLECRRQEKNFFIRTSMDAIQSYTANLDSANTLILRLLQQWLPSNIRTAASDLTDQMGNYNKAFRATSIYRRDHPVGNNMVTMMHMCTETARQCHSLVASISAESKQQYQAICRTAGTLTLILLVGTPVLSILIALAIYREILLREHLGPASK